MDNGASSYRRFLDGDNSGLRDLIEEYRLPLQMFILSIVNNNEIAEDAAIETFVKLAAKKPKYNGEASFKTWLFRIGRNTAVDLLRKERKTSTESLENINEPIYVQPSPEDMYIKGERNKQLVSSMKKLKREYFTVLWLRYFEDMQVKEIASVIKKSEGNTKVLLSRAREALKNQLGKDGFDYEDK